MRKKPKTHKWLVPALIAVLLFLLDPAVSMVSDQAKAFLEPYRVWVWLAAGLALALTVFAIYVNGKSEDDIDPGEVSKAYQKMLERYLRRIARDTQFLTLPATDVKSRDATTKVDERLRLTDVYIKLNTTTKVEEEKDRKRTRPLSALEALTLKSHIVLLGDPGSGKSTFANHLAFCLASDQLDPREGWIDRLDRWPEAWRNLLPVPVTLRDFAFWFENEQPKQHKADLLEAYLRYWLKQRQQSDFADSLLKLLRQGEALLLIDGLDEVPPIDAVAGKVVIMLDDLTKTFSGPILVTCRVLSYEDERWQLSDDWPAFELDKLNGKQIDWFIAAWYNHLDVLGLEKNAKHQIVDLRRAVRRRDLWRMARNPLLLTVMTLLHSRNRVLPEEAARVYKEAVELLLWRWETAKPTQGKTTDWRMLLQQAGVSDGDVLDVLSRLAFDAHRQMTINKTLKARQDKSEITADIPEERLRKALAGLIEDDNWGWDWAGKLLDVIKHRAGLLVENPPGIYHFPHRTFQEYLAGSYLCVQGDFVDQAVGFAAQGAYWWDVILLGVGHLKHVNRDVDKALALINELCPSKPPALDDEIGWRNVWLAGRCLREMGHISPHKDLGKTLKQRLPQRLTFLITHDLLEPRERAEAGSVLSELGDPRNLAEMVLIPAGEFHMGSTEEDEDADEDETPQHPVFVAAFEIGKYPVTNGQYAHFVAETGHRPPYHWQEQTAPVDLLNHPVTGVSWYDAVEYCQWLSKKEGRKYRLPTEAEWERAARSDDKRVYPWGNDFDPRKCNMAETGVGRTSPVGIFAAGVSLDGCLDMSGNVWEWTLSTFVEYPYKDDNRNQIDNPGKRRVLRGGSFLSYRRRVRCAYRDLDDPDFRDVNIGFRVVAPSPQVSETSEL